MVPCFMRAWIPRLSRMTFIAVLKAAVKAAGSAGTTFPRPMTATPNRFFEPMTAPIPARPSMITKS